MNHSLFANRIRRSRSHPPYQDIAVSLRRGHVTQINESRDLIRAVSQHFNSLIRTSLSYIVCYVKVTYVYWRPM